MSFIKEFRAFTVRGNMVDMAVGVVVGGAFGKIVSSLVSDVIMPPVGLLTGGVHFSKLTWTIKEATLNNGIETAAVTINYGNFLQMAVEFLIIAFCIFMMVKALNTFKKKEGIAISEPSKEEILLSEIRDILKEKGEK
jgi:large conductance mechanosensitive channel